MNERRTKRNTDGQAMMDCEKCNADWTGKHGKPMADCTALYCRNRLLDRLVAYEDTGMAPEEIKAPLTEDAMINLEAQALDVEADRLRELAEADKDGRVIVLPAKKGDTLYAVTRFGVEKRVVKEIAAPFFYNTYESSDRAALSTDIRNFGKTVFLTHEEAEKALREMEGKKDGNETSM